VLEVSPTASSNRFNGFLHMADATAKSPKNAAKTTATLQNQAGKVLLTLASWLNSYKKTSSQSFCELAQNCSAVDL